MLLPTNVRLIQEVVYAELFFKDSDFLCSFSVFNMVAILVGCLIMLDKLKDINEYLRGGEFVDRVSIVTGLMHD